MNILFPGLGLLLTIVSFLISSWFLIHILALLGIFLAFAYPLWWLFFPKQTVCLLCQAGKNGDKCLFCKRPIEKNISLSPANLSSAIFNGILILLFSFVSIGLVFVESQLLFKLGFPPTPKTVSFVIPTKGQYRLGEIFPMKIEIAGIKVPINAVQADLGFDSRKLEVIDISTEGSFANIFIQKEINNEAGYARLSGGLPNPGFFANQGVFGIVFFKTKNPGVVKVEYLPTSMVLANDGRGTNVLKELGSVSFLILPETISKEEEEAQKSIIIKSTVLGESTNNNTQMRFYEEKDVLGAKVEQEIKKEKKFNLIKLFFGLLERFDRFVLEQWGKIFNLLRLKSA